MVCWGSGELLDLGRLHFDGGLQSLTLGLKLAGGFAAFLGRFPFPALRVVAFALGELQTLLQKLQFRVIFGCIVLQRCRFLLRFFYCSGVDLSVNALQLRYINEGTARFIFFG